MARKFVRRLRIEDCPRGVWEADGLPPGLVEQVLNTDDETGARTLVVGVMAGWTNETERWHSCDEEFLVLDGSIEIGGTTYTRGQYVFRPAGSVHGPTASSEGCRLLYWHEGAFDVRTDAPPAEPSPKPFIDGLDTTVGREGWDVLPIDVPKDIGMIRMRHAEETGCDNTLEWLPTGFKSQAREYHTADEEILILDGWAATDADNVYVAGEYIYWLAGTLHGPTQAWNCKAVVKHYGKHETVHVREGLDLRTDPASQHRPDAE